MEKNTQSECLEAIAFLKSTELAFSFVYGRGVRVVERLRDVDGEKHTIRVP